MDGSIVEMFVTGGGITVVVVIALFQGYRSIRDLIDKRHAEVLEKITGSKEEIDNERATCREESRQTHLRLGEAIAGNTNTLTKLDTKVCGHGKGIIEVKEGLTRAHARIDDHLRKGKEN